MEKIKPLAKDIYIKRNSDKTLAHLGHINYLIDAITALENEWTEAATVAALGASTDITAVPGAFADEAAIQTYLATAVPIIETRLDNLESKINAILTSIKNAGLMAS